MENEAKSSIGWYGWVRFISGLIVLAAMLYYDLQLEQDIEVYLYAFPAYLLGIDVGRLIKPK